MKNSLVLFFILVVLCSYSLSRLKQNIKKSQSLAQCNAATVSGCKEPDQKLTSPNGNYALVLMKDGGCLKVVNVKGGSSADLFNTCKLITYIDQRPKSKKLALNPVNGPFKTLKAQINQGGNLEVSGDDLRRFTTLLKNGSPDYQFTVTDKGVLQIINKENKPVWSYGPGFRTLTTSYKSEVLINKKKR